MEDRPDPRVDVNGRPSILLSGQFRGFKNNDPPTKQQVAVTGLVLRKFYSTALSTLDKIMCEFFIGAFFFAMRSCEYLNVSGKKKTKILTIKNIRFFKGRSEVHHSNPYLHLDTTVSITFEFQIKDTKMIQ